MWIGLRSKLMYAIRIYVDGVNIVTGTKKDPTKFPRIGKHMFQGQSTYVQDYVMAPGQKWIDGAFVEPGKFRQFVATPIKPQTPVVVPTGTEVVGMERIEFEIIAVYPPLTYGPLAHKVVRIRNM